MFTGDTQCRPFLMKNILLKRPTASSQTRLAGYKNILPDNPKNKHCFNNGYFGQLHEPRALHRPNISFPHTHEQIHPFSRSCPKEREQSAGWQAFQVY